MAQGDQTSKKKTKRPTAQKRNLQNQKRNLNNRIFTSRVKTTIRSFDSAISNKESSSATQLLSALFSQIDKGVKRGIYKLNKARRMKSKLAKKSVL